MSKRLTFFVILLLSFLLFTDLKAAETGAKATVDMKKKSSNRGRVEKIDLTTKVGGKVVSITDSGRALQRVRNFFSTCFNKDTNVKDLTTKIQAMYEKATKVKDSDYEIPDFINETSIQKKYDIWKDAWKSEYSTTDNVSKAKKAVLDDIKDVLYTRPNFFGIFPRRAKKFYLSSQSCKAKHGETLEQQLVRCSNQDQVLECALNVKCTTSTPDVKTTPDVNTTEEDTKVYETKTIPCEYDKETFGTDSSVLTEGAKTKIRDCLKNIPTTATNVRAEIECCSTTVGRASGTNRELTSDREDELFGQLKLRFPSLKVNSGDDPNDKSGVTLIKDYQNQFYNPKTNELEYTGTCGPLTDADPKRFYESWTKYADQTTQIVKKEFDNAEELLGSGSNSSPHFAWLREKQKVRDKNHPDVEMGAWRYNKIKIYYDVEAAKTIPQKPVITTIPTQTVKPTQAVELTKKILCLKLMASEGVYKRKTGGGGTSRKHTAFKIHTLSGKDIPCPDFGPSWMN